MRIVKHVLLVFLVFISASCSKLILQPADFAWPVENVIKIDDKGFIEEPRYSFTINVKPLFQEEFADSNLAIGKEIRIIRDNLGYYYLTGINFKNVYLFLPDEGGMQLEETYLISETGLLSPVMNQKSPNIELIDGDKIYILNNNGIVR
ncbi:MAG: hypothetical protein AB1521_06910 [Bacteroidota bacterium]